MFGESFSFSCKLFFTVLLVLMCYFFQTIPKALQHTGKIKLKKVYYVIKLIGLHTPFCLSTKWIFIIIICMIVQRDFLHFIISSQNPTIQIATEKKEKNKNRNSFFNSFFLYKLNYFRRLYLRGSFFLLCFMSLTNYWKLIKF